MNDMKFFITFIICNSILSDFYDVQKTIDYLNGESQTAQTIRMTHTILQLSKKSSQVVTAIISSVTSGFIVSTPVNSHIFFVIYLMI